MRIILNQDEIDEAIEKLILDQVIVPDDMRIDIALKATRGDLGYTAEVDIVAHNAPTDGTDRSIDDRVVPAEDDVEGLGIAEKVLAAKANALLPKRRGRPAGARNRASQMHSESAPAVQQEQAQEASQEPETVTEELPAVETENVPQEQQEAAEQPDVQPEPAAEIAQPETTQDEVQEVQEVTQPVEEAPTEEADVEDTETATDVNEQDTAADEADQTDQSIDQPEAEPEPNSEAALAAEAQATEPVNKLFGGSTETASAAPAPTAPTRSLFANLGKPNG